jgi:ubiquinone/menaquinone biosynthesis C-methylase UbiE
MAEQEYLHGFSKKEQQRLLHQAQFLEPWVYQGIDLGKKKHLLEVGCGVGAQTKILAKRFPNLKIDAVDRSDLQLSAASRNLKGPVRSKQVRLFQQDALNLNLEDKGQYDSAFLCWLLEHVPDPVQVLKQVRKNLKPGAIIYCTEVFNQTLFMEPYSPAFMKYWFEFNDEQWSIKGYPFIGASLGNFLKQAGFKDIQTEMRPFHFDSRNPKMRAEFTEYFFNILLSAEKTLLAKGRVTRSQIKEMKAEVQRVKRSKDAVFFYAFVRATARVP